MEVPLAQVVKKGMRQRERSQGPAEEEGAGDRGFVDDLVGSFRQLYSRLHRLDRICGWILAVAFIAPFLPWYHVEGFGLIAGIERFGAISAVLIAAALTAIYLRTARRRLSRVFASLQLGAVLLALGPALLGILVPGDFAPRYGVFLFLLLGVAAIVLTIARLMRA
jgi:hypothetical protein